MLFTLFGGVTKDFWDLRPEIDTLIQCSLDKVGIHYNTQTKVRKKSQWLFVRRVYAIVVETTPLPRTWNGLRK